MTQQDIHNLLADGERVTSLAQKSRTFKPLLSQRE